MRLSVAFLLAVLGVSAMAQTPAGPIGRAIRATQVLLDGSKIAHTTNVVLQPVAEDFDAALGSLDASTVNNAAAIEALASTIPTVVKGYPEISGGHIVFDEATATYTVYFPPSGSGGSSSNGTGFGTSTMPVGTVSTWVMDTTSIPAGWLLCDGSSYATNDFPDLYAKIGFRYSAGSGSTFNVPDYRGVVLQGVDLGANVDPFHASRTSSGFGGGPEQAGSWLKGMSATTNTATQVRPKTVYVHYIIKAVDDLKMFLRNIVLVNGSHYAFSAINGIGTLTHPPVPSAGGGAWPRASTLVSTSSGSTGWRGAAKNTVITAWYTDGNPKSGSNPTLLGFLSHVSGSALQVSRSRMQSSDPYKDGDTAYCITFVCPAGSSWLVKVDGWRNGSTMVVYAHVAQ